MDLPDGRALTPPDAGPDDDDVISQVQVTDLPEDVVQPPQQMIPVQSPDEIAPDFVELLQPQVL